MDQINVQRWASSLRQFHRQPPIVTDASVGNPNGVRNASTTREYESSNNNHQYSFTLNEKRNLMSEDSNRLSKSQFYTFDTFIKDNENLQSISTTQHSENRLSDPHETDAVSEAGTYIIEDDDSEQKINCSSSSFKRYANQAKNRHGTFDIHGLISSTAHTIHRPIVDSNLLKKDLSLSSSNSSLLSFNEDEENKSSVQQQSLTLPTQNQIKPAEAFVISPGFEMKSLPITNIPKGKVEVEWKSKPIFTKESNLESLCPLSSIHVPAEKYSFHLQKQPPSSSLKTSIRPHSVLNDQTSSFQRQITSANAQYQRQTSSLSTTDNDEITSNLSKIHANKSFILRQQRSNIRPLKSTLINSNSQTNRAVELRRARAQAKIEELAQRTKKQLYKPNQQTDVMSASWHSHATSTNKSNLRTTLKTKSIPQKEDLSVTRTLSSSLYQRALSTSPIPVEEQHDQKMIASIEGERCDLLRDNGQRLAIKLIQLSSGILEKLKPNDIVTVHELEQLVGQLQTINRTLSSIDAALTGPTDDNTFV